MGALFLTTSNGKTIVRDPVGCGAQAMDLARSVVAGSGATLGEVLSRDRSDRVYQVRRAVVMTLWGTGRYSQSDIARFLNRHPSAINIIIHGRRATPWSERKRAA